MILEEGNRALQTELDFEVCPVTQVGLDMSGAPPAAAPAIPNEGIAGAPKVEVPKADAPNGVVVWVGF